ncbi:hypothetical protein [Longimicrobium sp.]|uniref:hypothetical protein n=1 Tax=Longimicrobium sp. TaxID=2029185 RepID=UPI002C4B2DBF|nr:hypothetical protein [Longimicrobium sp.]HSU15745.1 hypothetical protein [Longimicrobium sp.]
MIPGELLGLTAIVIGGLAILIPIAGLTARVALKPIVEAMARYRELKGTEDTVDLLERRIGLIEQQLDGVDRSLRVLVEDADFRRRLEATSPAAAAALPSSSSPERVA